MPAGPPGVGRYLLGVDIGTSSSKGLLATPAGEIVATAQRNHDVDRPRPGWAEQDAEGLWWREFQSLCAELLPVVDAPPAALCVAGLGPCLVPADEDGRPLRPAILYGVDTRASREIDELNERYGQQTILERCGARLSSQAVGPKMLWLRRNEPEVWQQTRRFFTTSSFIVHRLTGEYVLDHHSASQSAPLYDLTANRWIQEWSDEIAPRLPLPRLLWPADIAGWVTGEAAQETGLPAGTAVATGTIDTRAEAASIGVRMPGDGMLMYGTTMFMLAVLSELRIHPSLWATTFLRPGSYNLSAGMAAGGALTQWLRDIAGNASYEELTKEAAGVPAGSDGLVVLPYFVGERTPIYDPRARGVICGLSLTHRRGHLYRALLEGTAYGVRHNLEVMKEAGASPSRLVAVGGGTKAPLWPQIVSDVTGTKQELPRHTIGASYGAALLAAIAAGLAEPGADWNAPAETVEPDEAKRGDYDTLYSVYRELYPATREQVHMLAGFQR